MLTVSLFTVAKIQKPPKRPSIDEWIKKYIHIYMNVCIHTHTQYSITQSTEGMESCHL